MQLSLSKKVQVSKAYKKKGDKINAKRYAKKAQETVQIMLGKKNTINQKIKNYQLSLE